MLNPRMARLCGAVAVLAAGAAPAAGAQSGLTLWGGVGTWARSGEATSGRTTTHLGAQLAVPLVPVAVRAEVMAVNSDFAMDRLSYNFNAVARMPLPLVQPYAIAGRGAYRMAPGLKEYGWNTGAGVRAGIGRVGLFAEMRRHHPIRRTITTVGVTF